MPADAFDADEDLNTSEPTPDPDGVSRVTDCEVDIGAYEFLNPADVNGDGAVAFADILQVIANWGPCPAPPAGCPADVNGNGQVDFADILQVIAAWSPECNGASSLEEALIEIGLDMDAFEELIDVLENGREAEKANYLCWFNHYVQGCEPLCSYSCRGPDPWGGH